MQRVYSNENVFTATQKRIKFIFDEFEEINVSVSGGKDSTALLGMVMLEAEYRNRKVNVFFLDQEAEYSATIDVLRIQMSHRLVNPLWYQVPIYMTNATSLHDTFLYAWGEGEKWMREKEKKSIVEISEEYPKRFYEFFPWLEAKNPKAAYLIGLRAEESITRYRAVTKHAGYQGLKWSTISESGANRFYPIYDWTWNSVWRFIYEYNLAYNKIYDLMFWANYSLYKMRVSNLIHEKAYKCLSDLPKFEPETYDKLCKRISGISTASRYASEKLVFSNKKLPLHYKSWLQFRDFLLENIPSDTHKNKFIQRFEKQEKNERIYQAQVGQLLIMDFENSKSFDPNKEEKTQKLKEKWMQLL